MIGDLIPTSTNFDAAPSNLDIIRDLARVKVSFQARAIAAVMGLPQTGPAPNSVSQQGEYDDQVT